jgi:hypothetical protein
MERERNKNSGDVVVEISQKAAFSLLHDIVDASLRDAIAGQPPMHAIPLKRWSRWLRVAIQDWADCVWLQSDTAL